MKEQLTENFYLHEFERSSYAKNKGFLNKVPNLAIYNNIKALAEDVLQPVRERFGQIMITSGYRSEHLNRKIQGSNASQHMIGEAADIVPMEAAFEEVYRWIEENCDYDQLIYEKKGTSTWIHVSYKRKNRRHAFTIIK